jgi:DNA repair exonuclease SbcCD ATPase subunit
MIEKIKIQGLKGADGIYSLAPLTAIVAPNASGKTAILDAIQLVTTGSHPAFGKTGKAIMQMAPGTSLSIEATTDGGKWLKRAWTMSKTGSVKTTAHLPDDWDGTGLAMAFSPTQFLGLNARGRVDYILASVPDGTIPEGSKARDRIDREMTGPARLTPAEVEAFDRPIVDVLADAKDACIEARRATKQDRTRSLETVRGLEDGMRDTEAPERVEKEVVDEKGKAYLEAMRELTRIAERHREASRRLEKFTAIPHETWTPAYEDRLATVEAEFLELEKVRRSGTNIEQQITAIMRGAPEPEEVEEAEERVIARKHERPTEGLEDIREEVIRLRQDEATTRELLQRGTREFEDYARETDKLLQQDACPTCGAAGAAFRKPLAEARAEKLGKIEREMEGHMEHLETIAGDVALCQEKIKILEAYKLLEQDKEATMAIDQLRRAQANVPDAGRLEEVREEVRALRQRKIHAAALKSMGEIPTKEAIADLATLEAECRDVTEARRVEALVADEGHATWLRHGGAMRQLKTAKQHLEAAEIRLTKIADLLAYVEGAAASMAQAISDPLRRGLQAFTVGVLPGEVHVQPDLALAYVDDRGTRPFDALSGGERAVIAFALSAFLATLTPLRLACFDEASVLDKQWRPAFLRKIAERVADGTLAQAIATDHNRSGFADAGWTLLTPKQK